MKVTDMIRLQFGLQALTKTGGGFLLWTGQQWLRVLVASHKRGKGDMLCVHVPEGEVQKLLDLGMPQYSTADSGKRFA